MGRLAAVLLATVAFAIWIAPTAFADSPAVVRQMTCVAEDGTTTTFTGQQVPFGTTGKSMWRNVSGTDPAGFSVHGISLIDPATGDVLATFGNPQGVDRHFDLVTCSFIITQGPNAGRQVSFEGFFVPAN